MGTPIPSTEALAVSNAGVDRLSALLERFRVRAHLFHAGPLCGVTHFAAQPGRAFLHVLLRGDIAVTHQPRSGAPRRLQVSEPTLLFYPRPLDHDFHNAPVDGSDFVCATLDFDGGVRHPLVQALPSVLALPVAQVQGIAFKCGQALEHAQRQGLVHRDIKPANIMYDSGTDAVKVTDFGIARITDSSKTRTGLVLGTPSFMSPEQLAGKKVDGRSDL